MKGGREVAEKFFSDWEAEVRSNVPAERLLVFEAKDGWGPLCEFLGVEQHLAPRTCYKCKEKGHMCANCPNKN